KNHVEVTFVALGEGQQLLVSLAVFGRGPGLSAIYKGFPAKQYIVRECIFSAFRDLNFDGFRGVLDIRGISRVDHPTPTAFSDLFLGGPPLQEWELGTRIVD